MHYDAATNHHNYFKMARWATPSSIFTWHMYPLSIPSPSPGLVDCGYDLSADAPITYRFVDYEISPARQDRMSSWWLFNPCETSCCSTSTSSSIFWSMMSMYIRNGWEKGTVQKCANSQDFLVIRMNLYGPYHV